MLFGLLPVIDEELLQASNDAPDLIELSLQFKELLLGDVLLRLCYPKQDEEKGFLRVRFVQPFQPLLDDR